MTKKGFLALMGALVLTIAVVVGAWSYSMAEVVGEGTMKVTTSPEALIGVPTFGVGPFVEVVRTKTGAASFNVTSRTANDVNVSMSLRYAEPKLNVVLSGGGAVLGGGTVACSVGIAPTADLGSGPYLVQLTVIAQGSGFRAAIDADVPVGVKNAAPVAAEDTASATKNTPKIIVVTDLLSNDTDPDGPHSGLSVTAVSATSSAGGTVVLSGTNVTFTPKTDFTGTDTFTYTVSDGTDTATATVTVTVNP